MNETAQRDMTGKVVAVTGASRGIGYACAVEAARRGAHIIAAARTVGGLEDLDDAVHAVGSSTTIVPLDLADLDAIDRLGAAIFERWGHLDGLIGNAGLLGTVGPVPHLPPDEFEKVFKINVTANFRLIRSFDLLLRQSVAGRAVFVSSSAAQSGKPYWGLYGSSKAALDALVKSYAAEMAKTSVRANVYYPAPTRTAMRAKAMPGEDPETLPTPESVAPQIVDMLCADWQQNGMILNGRDGSLTPL